MEVIAFFLLFAVTNYAVAGGKKKTEHSAPKAESGEPSAAAIFTDLGRSAVTKMQAIGTEKPADNVSAFPSELTQSRSWDEYEAPAYRRL